MYRNQKIVLLHSEEEDKMPESLELGELAVNCYKDKEFICLKNTDNQIIKISPSKGNDGAWKKVEGNKNSLITEGNTSIGDYSLTHGQWIHNNGSSSFVMGVNDVQIEYIEKNGKTVKIPHDDSIPYSSDYYIGAFICDSEGNKLSDVISGTYNANEEMDVLELSNEIDTNIPLHIELNTNTGMSDFLFGSNNKNDGNGLISFGTYNCNTGYNNFINGTSNIANTNYNALFGKKNTSVGGKSFVNGEGNSNTGTFNLISGYNNKAVGNYGILVGSALKTKNNFESAFGVLNDCDSDNYVFTVGNGIETTRHNAFAITNKGEVFIQSKAKEEGEEYPPMISIQSLISRIKDLEEKYADLKRRYDDIHL